MSLFTTLNAAASGIGASSASLSVIGDNIANVGTTGFKGSRAEFSDFLPQDVFGLSGPSTMGTGAAVSTVSTIFGQGTLESSENALDMAISGNGFFIVGDGNADYYTRDGTFYLDDEGYVVNASGLRLQGYNEVDGSLGATVGDIQIDTSTLSPSATSTVVVDATLSVDADYLDPDDPTSTVTPISDGDYDITSGDGDSLETVADAADFSTSMTVYDSLGQSHEVTLVFERTGESTWSWWALVDAGEVTDSSGSTYTAGSAFTIAQGELEFDTSGDLSSFTQTNTSSSTSWNFFGAEASDISFDFGLDDTGATTDGSLKMLGTDSAVTALTQDGYPPGSLSGLSVDSDGVITGSYSNGEELELGQVVLASFTATGALERLGNNLFGATLASGDPAVGAPGTGGRGSVTGNALEASNVDLEEEFVNMITTQRSYQANARVLSTASDTLQELVQIV